MLRWCPLDYCASNGSHVTLNIMEEGSEDDKEGRLSGTWRDESMSDALGFVASGSQHCMAARIFKGPFRDLSDPHAMMPLVL